MKTMNIKGKDYVPVSERVLEFHRLYPEGTIQTAISYDGSYVRCRAVVCPNVSNPTRSFSGHAEEDRNQGNINKTNATENAETGAVGRALGLMGIGIIEGIASADEIVGAEHKAYTLATSPAQPSKPFQPTMNAPASLGTCKDCGAGNAWSAGKQKAYCSAKCWLQPTMKVDHETTRQSDMIPTPPREAFDQAMEVPF